MIKPGFIRFLNRFVIKVMERRIGNKFELNNTTLTVVESKDANCDYCFLFKHHLSCSNESTRAVVGACDAYERCDHKDVIFVKVNNDKEDKQ